jgi:hypothetical protein
MMKRNLLLFLSLALSANASLAQDTIFGLQFNKPIQLPECPYRTAAGMKLYQVTSEFTCAWAVEQKSRDPLPSRTVVIDSKNAPKYMKGLFKAYVQGEALVGLRFFTFGIHSQDATLAQLKQKYGEPIALSRRAVQTAGGAAVEAVSAQWLSETIAVSFEGIVERIDLGEVTIDTSEFLKLRLQETQKKNSSEVKM